MTDRNLKRAEMLDRFVGITMLAMFCAIGAMVLIGWL